VPSVSGTDGFGEFGENIESTRHRLILTQGGSRGSMNISDGLSTANPGSEISVDTDGVRNNIPPNCFKKVPDYR